MPHLRWHKNVYLPKALKYSHNDFIAVTSNIPDYTVYSIRSFKSLNFYEIRNKKSLTVFRKMTRELLTFFTKL